jgi:hypothetical protein
MVQSIKQNTPALSDLVYRMYLDNTNHRTLFLLSVIATNQIDNCTRKNQYAGYMLNHDVKVNDHFYFRAYIFGRAFHHSPFQILCEKGCVRFSTVFISTDL